MRMRTRTIMTLRSWGPDAQRVPVRTHLDDMHRDLLIAEGTTCKVTIRSSESGPAHGRSVNARPVSAHPDSSLTAG